MWEWCELVLFPACEYRGVTSPLLLLQMVPAVPLPGDCKELGHRADFERELKPRAGPGSGCHKIHWLLALGFSAPSRADRKDLPVWSMALPSWRAGCFRSRCGCSPCTQLMWHLGQLITALRELPIPTSANCSSTHSCRAQVGSNSNEANSALIPWK